MKRFLWVLLLVTAAPALPAQNPPDSSDEVEAQQLRQQIRERWSQRVRQDLGLSDEQAAKLQATEQNVMQQRIGLAQRARDTPAAPAAPPHAASDRPPRALPTDPDDALYSRARPAQP